ncbi:protein YgfX [Massilia endophytica]|uniref:protein YgfX n=1 Tax=Massilia endophytica TaxID=2899220 RepID=UPI001E5FA628|nr:protein YgfX [Massilia endophytica]UGQ44593.1 hypothetical protein LSQ66_12320 [Massilia endophytica]
MSGAIALSLVIRASPRLRLLRAGFGLTLAAGGLVQLPSWPGGVLLACALTTLLALCRPVKPVGIDISGVGRIRLTVYQQQGVAVRLLPGSTFWPWLMLLRLEGGRIRWLLVLPDSVAPDGFRRLALALRAIAARG